MLLLLVLKERFILVLQLVPLGSLVMGAWVRALLIGWTRDEARARCRWAESSDFCRECVVHFVLNFRNNLLVISGVVSRAWIGVEGLTDHSVLGRAKRSRRVTLMVELGLVIGVVNTRSHLVWSNNLPKFSLSLSSLQVDSHLLLLLSYKIIIINI